RENAEGAGMLVDPELLRAFAKQVDDTAVSLSDMSVGFTASSAADGLPGSETQWATRQVGAHLGVEANDLLASIALIGVAVRGAGDSDEVTDETLAGSFEKLF